MTVLFNLDRIKILLLQLLKSSGLTDDDLNKSGDDGFDWKIDWKEDLDDLFMGDLQDLQAALDLHEKALANGDLLTARAGLLHARISSSGMKSFFDAFSDDLSRAATDERLNWPKLPENYRIPSEYGYEEF